MYSLLSRLGLQESLTKELVPFILALFIAQIWFKWGSFALELLGFVVVWFVLGFVSDLVLRAIRR